jgi:hypothetical protein
LPTISASLASHRLNLCPHRLGLPLNTRGRVLDRRVFRSCLFRRPARSFASGLDDRLITLELRDDQLGGERCHSCVQPIDPRALSRQLPIEIVDTLFSTIRSVPFAFKLLAQ